MADWSLIAAEDWQVSGAQLAVALISGVLYLVCLLRALARADRREHPDRSPIWLWLVLVAPVWIIVTMLIIRALAVRFVMYH